MTAKFLLEKINTDSNGMQCESQKEDLQENQKNAKESEAQCNSRYKVTVKIPKEIGWIENVCIIIKTTKNENVFNLYYAKTEEQHACFETEIMLETCACYHYNFSFDANYVKYYINKDSKVSESKIIENEGGITTEQPSINQMWKLSVNFKVPDWAQGAIMYHIFIDRYKRGSNQPIKMMPRRKIHKTWEELPVLEKDEDGLNNVDFFCGDLKGITNTINYIKSMGIDIIYLSPIVESQSNHRYDTGNYFNVDPYAGTNDDLKKLCETAHKNGIKVILDAVLNHTGNDSIYFNEFGTYPNLGAYQSIDSEYYDFYKKNYKEDGTIEFDYWWGEKNLPVCDGNSKKWQNYVFKKGGVIDNWFSYGIDGLRLDVADELTDEFIEKIREASKRNRDDAFIIGEVWKNPMRMNRNYIESGKGMDSVMNYLFVDSLIRYFKYGDADKFKEVVEEISNEYPDETINSLMNFTSTHDISRAIEIFSRVDDFQKNGEWSWNLVDDTKEWITTHKLTETQIEYGKNIMKTYFTTLAFCPGMLSIFYGDEVGLSGLGNLANRAPYPWGKEDKEILEYIKKVLNVRKNEKFLKKANMRILDIDNQKLIFERYSEEENIVIAINRTDNKIPINISRKYENKEILFKRGQSSISELDSMGVIIIKN